MRKNESIISNSYLNLTAASSQYQPLHPTPPPPDNSFDNSLSASIKNSLARFALVAVAPRDRRLDHDEGRRQRRRRTTLETACLIGLLCKNRVSSGVLSFWAVMVTGWGKVNEPQHERDRQRRFPRRGCIAPHGRGELAWIAKHHQRPAAIRGHDRDETHRFYALTGLVDYDEWGRKRGQIIRCEFLRQL